MVEDENISQIGQNLQFQRAEIVDATGKLVLPGGVDPHVHLDLPMFGTVSSDDHYTGTKAAAFGGTTTVIDFVSFDFPSMRESVEKWQAKAEKAAVDYSAHMNLTRFDDKIAAEIPSLREMGITSLKVFTAYNGRLRLEDGNIFKALRIARETGTLVMLHAENGDVIDITDCRGAGCRSYLPRMARQNPSRLGRGGVSAAGVRTGCHCRCAAVPRPYEYRRGSGYAPLCAGARGKSDGRNLPPVSVFHRR